MEEQQPEKPGDDILSWLQRHKKPVIAVGVAVLIVAIGAVFVLARSDKGGVAQTDKQDKSVSSAKQEAGSVPDTPWSRDCEGTGTVKMKHSPMNQKDFSNILPVGMLAGAHVTPIDHLYFSPASYNSPRDAYLVYAMADGFIVDISTREMSVDSGETKKAEYRIVFQHTCTFYSYFDLVTSLAPDLLEAYEQKGSQMHIPVKAGQLIGRIGGQTLDTAVYNFDMTLSGFVNPDTYKSEFWKVHTDDFFKYFDEPLRSQLLARNLRKVEPYGGKIDYDVAGKMVGNWFQEGTNGYAGPSGNTGFADSSGRGYWSGHLALVYDAIDAKTILLSFGDYKDSKPENFAVKGNAPDPATLGVDSGVVKYELVQPPNYTLPGGATPAGSAVEGTALFQLVEPGKLKMEVFPRKTAAQISGFTSDAKLYVR